MPSQRSHYHLLAAAAEAFASTATHFLLLPVGSRPFATGGCGLPSGGLLGLHWAWAWRAAVGCLRARRRLLAAPVVEGLLGSATAAPISWFPRSTPPVAAFALRSIGSAPCQRPTTAQRPIRNGDDIHNGKKRVSIRRSPLVPAC